MASQTTQNTFKNSTRISGPHHPVTVIRANYNHHGEDIVVAAKLLLVETDQDYDDAVKEAINMRTLCHVPRVVKLYDYVRTRGQFENDTEVALVMEYCELGSLQQDIKKRRESNPPQPYSEDQLKTFMVQSVEVFAAAQDQGLYHRDIKPDNIFLHAEMGFKIGDFGISSSQLQATRKVTKVVGTPSYAVYEIADQMAEGLGKSFSQNYAKADVVSLGLTIFAMCLLKAPRGMNLSKSYQEKQDEGFAQINHLSQHFKWFLERMLTRNESDRPTFKDLLGMLRSQLSYEETPLVVMRPRLSLPPPISDSSSMRSSTISVGSSQSDSTMFGSTIPAGVILHPPSNIQEVSIPKPQMSSNPTQNPSPAVTYKIPPPIVPQIPPPMVNLPSPPPPSPPTQQYQTYVLPPPVIEDPYVPPPPIQHNAPQPPYLTGRLPEPNINPLYTQPPVGHNPPPPQLKSPREIPKPPLPNPNADQSPPQ